MEIVKMALRSLIIAGVLGVCGLAYAQGPVLPGKGLAQHDFFYAGESHDRNMYIVRGGKVVWSYSDPEGKGEISDAVLMSNGNVLFAHQRGVTEITSDKKVVWNYDAPAGYEVHTAVPIGLERVLYIQNGDPAVLRVVNTVTGVIEKEAKLKTHLPPSTHGQFRHARLTPQGTLMVAHMDLSKVVEYDENMNELWSFPGEGIWGVTPLANGNVLITDRVGVREITRRGDSVWSWKPAEAPGAITGTLQQAWRLPNGNTVINNWMNEWSKESPPIVGSLQLLEVTPEKKMVWGLASWTPPAALGPATTFQLVEDGAPAQENVHFGSIK
jgi:hypothetical protein